MPRIVKIKGEYKKAKVDISNLKARITRKTDRRIYDMVRTASTKTRQYINSRTKGFGVLAQSIKWKKDKRTNMTTWVIFQDPQKTRSKGKNYGLHVDGGFIPHFVKVKGNRNLQKWLEKNFGKASLNRALARDRVFVQAKEWNKVTEGLNYSGYAFRQIRMNVKKIDSAIKHAIKK